MIEIPEIPKGYSYCHKNKQNLEFFCNIVKPIDEMRSKSQCRVCQKKYKKAYYQKNIEERKQYAKEYREKNIDRIKEYKKDYRSPYYRNNKEKLREYRKKYKYQAFAIYGNRCKVCSWIDPKVLEFHHIKGNPRKDRGSSIHIIIVKNGKPLSDVELLCANHHILANLRDKTYNHKRL